MTRLIERLLRLQAGDLRRGSLLSTYLFLIMGSYMVARVSRDALFLDQFKALTLPWADLAISVLVGFVISGYLAIGRRLSLRSLLAGSLVFLALNSFLFWWLASFYEFKWLYPVVYIWVGIFGVLAPAQVWTLANFVLTTREAKRIFAFIGSGSILGAILGAKFASIMARRFGTESLLLAMAIAIALCAGIVPLIWRQRERSRLGAQTEGVVTQEAPPKVLESLQRIWSAPYVRTIAGLILVASVVTSVAGWQFKALAKQFINNTDQLAGFFGNFYFYAGIAGLLVQLIVTSRLLRRFGLGPALFVVPVALLLGSTGVLIWGTVTIWAAIALRSGINVLQYSIDKPSVELLYLPVSPTIKNQVKSFIDTVIWRSGDGLAAVGVLIFAALLGWNDLQSGIGMSWINLIFIACWFVVAALARRRYVGTLRESIQQHRLDAERATAAVLDRSTTDLLAGRLSAADPGEILYALSLFEAGREQASHPAVRGLLEHPAAEVRQKALSLLSAAGDRGVLPTVEKLLQDPDLGVRTEALLFLAQHANIDPLARLEKLGDFADFSVSSAVVAYLAHPGPAQNLVAASVMLENMANDSGVQGKRMRMEAARLIGRLPAPSGVEGPDQFSAQLRHLLTDPDPEVAAEAVRAVGKLRNRRFVFLLMDRIAEPALTDVVVEALSGFGDSVVGTLRDHLLDEEVSLEARREIPAVLAHVGTPDAARALSEVLLEGDTQLRFRTIAALNKIYQGHPEIARDTETIENLLLAEIMGHYRSYQILGVLGEAMNQDDAIARALRESINQEIERIFRLLGLLYPRYDLHSAYFGVQSSNPVVHDNALEFLDNILNPQLRSLMVPLLDSSVSVTERIQRANRLVGAEVEDREEAVAALVKSSDPWLKACGAYAAGILGLHSLEPDLDCCLEHPDPLLRETARQAKIRLAASAPPGKV